MTRSAAACILGSMTTEGSSEAQVPAEVEGMRALTPVELESLKGGAQPGPLARVVACEDDGLDGVMLDRLPSR